MGKKQSRVLKQLLAGQIPTIPSSLNRWFPAVLIATMMALSTVVVAAELPQQTKPNLAVAAVSTESAPVHGNSLASLQNNPVKVPLEDSALQGGAIKISQRIRRKDLWQEVQKRLPDLPLENNYTSSITGDLSETNTLIRRMIEYHNFRKGRSPRSRFDWKLTLADYLGLHDVIVADTYPGVNKLKINPINGDMTAVQAMNREQRNQLVNTLVSLYDPRIPAEFFTPASTTNSTTQEETSDPSQPPANPSPIQSSPPPLAEPGSADLLRPRS